MTGRIRTYTPNGRRANDVRGFSLIEFMVAILLGSILIAGAVGVYLGSKRSYTEVEQVAALAENARFSLSLLEDSLRHAGFFAAAGPGSILPDGDLTAIPSAADCTGRAAAYDPGNYLFGVQAASATVFSCITDAVVGTDVLVIKHLAPAPAYDADPTDATAARDGVISFPAGLLGTETYVIANAEQGVLFDGADTQPSVSSGEVYANGAAFAYRFYVYYVRNTGATPALARKTLAWDTTVGAMTVVTEDLVEGVENMQFLYGEDTDLDGEPEQFTNDTAVTNWDRVIAVRAFLLVQSTIDDTAYVDNRTYPLGDLSITPGGNRRRLMTSTEITLRNPRLVLRGGA
jgi:type IV pilus assembly protein PilW